MRGVIDIDIETDWTREWDRDTLTAFCVDAYTMWIHWEIKKKYKVVISQHFHCAWHELKLHIRICDITNIDFNGANAHSVIMLPVSSDVDQMYCRSLSSGCVYAVDLGLMLSTGDFFTIFRRMPIYCPNNHSGTSEFIRFLSVGETSLERPHELLNRSTRDNTSCDGVFIGY